MATKPQVKVAPERRGLTKVWNISDWPATDVKMQTVMVLGTTVPPGRCVEVPEASLKKAHKTMKDRDAGLVFIGDKPPQAYLDAMGRRKRLRMPAGAVRSRGPSKEDTAKANLKKAAQAGKNLKDMGKETAPAKPAASEAPKSESKGESKTETTTVLGSDKKKRK